MYRKTSKGWAKHVDFMLLDMICLQAAYFLAYFVRHGRILPLDDPLYRNMLFVFFFSQVFISFFNNSFKNVLKRGYAKEFTAAFRHVFLIVLLSTFYLFSTQVGGLYSRSTIGIMAALYFPMTYVVRCLWKKVLRKRGSREKGERSLVVLTTAQMVGEVIGNLRENDFSSRYIKGVALLGSGEDRTGQVIAGVPVVADASGIADYVCREWVDEVFLSLPREVPMPEELYNELIGMGVTVHLRLLRATKLAGQKQNISRIGTYTVLSSSINMVSIGQAVCKRLMDILGGLVGCLLTGILVLLIGPAIYFKSPGPIFYSQIRVGKNGRKFRLYKFRSMYPDADARKAELIAQNQVKDGRMFKLESDPRIIGGDKGIGGFIRRHSIDEFPQFWNVLAGDMSLVGTRPPTVEEWEKYELGHRVRLAAKPGITGMWQVNGRSRVTDFDEVVKLDKQYILEWGMGLDIRILLKTVVMMFKGDGAF